MAMEIRPIPKRVIAACFAMSAFTACIAAAAFSNVDGHVAIMRALEAMLVCYVMGFFVAKLAAIAIDEYVEQNKQKNPVPEEWTAEAIIGQATGDETGANTPEQEAEAVGVSQ